MKRLGWASMGILALLCVILAATVGGLALPASTAHAVPRPRTIAFAHPLPRPAALPPAHAAPDWIKSATACAQCTLLWHGGPVQRTPRSYVVFWGPQWLFGGPFSNVQQLILSYFRDVGGTPFENILTQYDDATGPISNSLRASGVWSDRSLPTADYTCGTLTISDTSIQREVLTAISKNKWLSDGNTTVFVYTPEFYVINLRNLGGSCSSGSHARGEVCGYHNAMAPTGVTYATIIYPSLFSACRVPKSPNGTTDGDTLVNTTSHEQFEAITDPQKVNRNGQLLNTGWIDPSGEEIGDKCQQIFPSSFTHLNNGGVFELQEEYSNAAGGCVGDYAPGAVYTSAGTGLYAFDPATGIRLWRYLAPCNLSAPVVAPTDGLVIASACKVLYAVDTDTGTLRWSYALGGYIVGAPLAAPITNQTTGANVGMLYVGADDGNMYALNASTGALAWKIPLAVGNNAPLVIGDDGELFVPSGGTLTALTASTGAQLWQNTYSNDTVQNLAYGDGQVYFGISYNYCTEEPCAGGRALDATSGNVVWYSGQDNPSTVAGGVLYESWGSQLVAYDARLNTSLWSITLSTTAHIPSAPTLANGLAYVGLSDGNLVAVDLSSHSVVWDYLADSAIQGSPLVVAGHLYMNSSSQYTYALDSAVGSLLWKSATAMGTSGAPAAFAPHLTITSASVVSRARPNANPAPTTFTIVNTGSQTLNWKLTSTLPSWLHLSMSSSAVVPGGSQIVTASFALSNLSQTQSQAATLSLADSTADDSPAQVTITALIGPPDTLYEAGGATLFAFDPASGTLLWRYFSPCQFSAPAVTTGGFVIASACKVLYAVDPATGTLRWSYALGGYIVGAPLAVTSTGLVYAGADDGHLYALNASTGALAWKIPLAVGNNAPLVIGDDGELFVPSGGTLTALTASTGAQLWQNTYSNDTVQNLAYGDGQVYFGASFNYCTEEPCAGGHAVDATTGYTVWNNGQDNPSTVAGGVLYESWGGQLAAFDASVGTSLWTVTVSTTAGISTAPNILNGIAYLTLTDGTIAAVNLSTQTILWDAASGGTSLTAAVVGDGDVFMAGATGGTLAHDQATGALLWQMPVGTTNTPALG